MPHVARPMLDRIYERTVPDGDCLLYVGMPSNRYPRIRRDGGVERVGVHVAVLEHKIGRRLTTGEEACHSCDRPRCIAEAHLFVGTNASNRADCVAKNRHAFGERNGAAVLSAEQVAEIRAADCSARGSVTRLCAQYGVHRATLHRIRSCRSRLMG